MQRAQRAWELKVWQDENQTWRWSWAATDLKAERGFWALGEAIVDAVVAHYPAAFDGSRLAEME